MSHIVVDAMTNPAPEGGGTRSIVARPHGLCSVRVCVNPIFVVLNLG